MKVPIFESNNGLMGVPGIRQGITPPPEAFGSGFVQNQARLGNEMQRKGAEMENLALGNLHTVLQMRADNDALVAKDAFLKANEDTRNMLWNPDNGIYARKGLNTMTAMEDTDKSMQDIYKKYTENLPDSSRKAFNQFWGSERANIMDSVARHKASELLNAHDAENTALLKSNIQDAALYYNNPVVLQTQIEHGDATIDSIGTLHGIPPDSARLAEMKREQRSKVYASVIDGALASGDTQYADKFFKEHEKDFNDEVRDKIGKYVKTRQDFSNAKSLIDTTLPTKLQETDKSENPSWAEYYKARDAKGSYLHGKDLNDETRTRIIEYAKQMETEKSNNTHAALQLDFAKGNLSPDMIDNLVKNGDMTPKSGNIWKADIYMQREKILNDSIEGANKLENQKAGQIEFELELNEWSDDPLIRAKQLNEFKTRALSLQIDPHDKAVLYNKIDSSLKEFERPDNTYKDDAVYQETKKNIKEAHTKGKLWSDPPGWGNAQGVKGLFGIKDPESPYQEARYTELMTNFKKMFRKNPNMTMEESQKWLDDNISSINAGKLQSVIDRKFSPVRDFNSEMSAWNGKTYPAATPQKPAISVGEIVNGWKFKGGDPKNQQNWEKN